MRVQSRLVRDAINEISVPRVLFFVFLPKRNQPTKEEHLSRNKAIGLLDSWTRKLFPRRKRRPLQTGRTPRPPNIGTAHSSSCAQISETLFSCTAPQRPEPL